MQRKSILIAVSFFTLILCACNSREDLPTLIPTVNDVPPTEEIQSAPTEVPTNAPVGRPTLPPTWTPTFEPTETFTPTPTEIVETFTPVPTPRTVSAACDTFAVDADRSMREFPIGTSPTVYWTPVVGARLYRVFLYTYSGDTIKNDIYVDTPEYTFDSAFFELGTTYLWSVWPLDPVGDQMCFERGMELIPQRVTS